MVKHEVVLQRICGRRTNDGTLKEQVAFLITRALGGSRGRGWDHHTSKIEADQQQNDKWLFTVVLTFQKVSGHKNSEIEAKQWNSIANYLIKTGKHTKYKEYPWVVVKGAENIADESNPIDTDEETTTIKDTKNYGDVNLDPTKYYDLKAVKYEDLYDRDHQRIIIQSAIKAAMASDFIHRFHTVLFGPPGCGKTDLLLATANMLGQENAAYMKFDATSTTAAGASKILLESDFVPPVLIVEEIEKTEESSLRWMLGILDQRAEIRRTNFRIGNRARNVKMLVLATVNDIDLFRKAMSGALASRFSNQVYCPRPNRIILAKILAREVTKIKGDIQWIEPALKFGHDEMGWDDPRKLVPICLQGREQLLDGTYQTSVRSTQLPVDLAKKIGIIP